jgi:hypothetical protein
VILAGGAAVALTVAPASQPAAQSQTGPHQEAGAVAGSKSARLASSTCSGPAGAAYLALPGYQAFDAIETANCSITQS